MENPSMISTDSPAPRCQLFIEVMKQVDQIADMNVPVLLMGSPGAGKALIASAIHHRSSRGHQPFVAIKCGAIPAELIDTELLQLLTSAEGGTLFLDEITDTPPSFQETLLQALRTREITQPDSDQAQQVDVRVIAASNHDVEQAVAEGRFSDDLFHYLSAVSIALPPLLRSEPETDDWVTLSVIEGRYVARVLEHTGGNKQAAARLLAIDRKTLDRMIKRHHIDSHHVKAMRARASARS
jgi:DNA-binding NtrC family response regulator